MKIAIIEDRPEDCRKLSGFLAQYCDSSKRLAAQQVFTSGKQFIETFQPDQYDVIFLDIFLDELNGMEIAQKIRETDKRALLIFVTVSPDFAVESYRVRAFHYLVKPYTYDQLAEVMMLCDNALSLRNRYIEVRESRMNIKVPFSDIVYVDSYNHYVHLHTVKRVVKSYMPFREAADILLTSPSFILCYRNCILNMDYVDSLQPNYFLMNNGEKISFSLTKRSSIKQQFLNYEFERLSGRDPLR